MDWFVEIIWRYPQNWIKDDKGNISISVSCMIFLKPIPWESGRRHHSQSTRWRHGMGRLGWRYWGTRVEATVGKDLLQLIKEINSYCICSCSLICKLYKWHAMVVLVAICVKRHLKTISEIFDSASKFAYLFGNVEVPGPPSLSLFRQRRTCSLSPKPPWMEPTERGQSTRSRQRMARIKVLTVLTTTRDLPSLAMTCHLRSGSLTPSYCGSMGSKKQKLAPNLHNLHVAWVQTIS